MNWRHRRPSLAPWACDPAQSRGRRYVEPDDAHRTPFHRDRDRIVHATAFRKLKHKTQVFVAHEGDHFRTRLTHSIEVAQIARSLARSLALDEDLAEAVSLAHDLGHTPFGHAGETALNAAMKPHGGFDHNGQALRIVTAMERRYAGHDGLNLSWETLEGLVKHNGPVVDAGAEAATAAWSIAAYAGADDLELDRWPGAEAQVAALADDIAYNNHDLDDGLRAGLFGFQEIRDLAIVRPWVRDVEARHPGLDPERFVFETLRRVFSSMVTDVLEETARRVAALEPGSVEDVRAAGGPVVGFSADMTARLNELRDFLFRRMYKHYRVNRMTSKARRVVSELFALLMEEPNLLPTPDLCAAAAGVDDTARARVISDYVSGLTDRDALKEYRELFDPQFDVLDGA